MKCIHKCECIKKAVKWIHNYICDEPELKFVYVHCLMTKNMLQNINSLFSLEVCSKANIMELLIMNEDILLTFFTVVDIAMTEILPSHIRSNLVPKIEP